MRRPPTVHALDYSDPTPFAVCGVEFRQIAGGTPYLSFSSNHDGARRVLAFKRLCGNCRRIVRARVSGGRAAGVSREGSTVKGSGTLSANSRRGRAAGRTKP